MSRGPGGEARGRACRCRIAVRGQTRPASRQVGGTHIREGLASFSLEIELLLDEPVVILISVVTTWHISVSITHSAAVCEFSDACDTELERGLDSGIAGDCDSAMVVRARRLDAQASLGTREG